MVGNSQFIMQKTEQLGLKWGSLLKSTFSVLIKTEISHHFFLKQGPTKKFAFMKFFYLFSKIKSLFYT